jgi:hypothetical protein
MTKKKLNPRNIPMKGRSINIDAIIDESMRHDMEHARLLVAAALRKEMSSDKVKELLDSLQESDVSEEKISHAEQLMGLTERPSVSLEGITTGEDLKKFKGKMKKLALHTALCSICLGLEKKGYTSEQLQSIFDDVKQIKNRIDNGEITYKDLKMEKEQLI